MLLPLVGPREEAEAELEHVKHVDDELFEATIGALDSLRDFVEKLNKGIEKNRWVLYLAALSFFIAAGISFFQGLN